MILLKYIFFTFFTQNDDTLIKKTKERSIIYGLL